MENNPVARSKCRWTRDEDLTLEESLDMICETNFQEWFPDRTFDAIRSRIGERGLERQRVTRNGLCYTSDEVAIILGVSRKQVRRWIISGLIAAEKVSSLRGNKFVWAIPWPSIDDLLTEYPMLFDSLPPRAIFAKADHHRALERGKQGKTYKTPIAEASRRGVCYQTIIRWIHEGRIKAKRVQGIWYIERSKLRNAA